MENEKSDDCLGKNFKRNFFQDPNLLPSQILNCIQVPKGALKEAKLVVSEFFLCDK